MQAACVVFLNDETWLTASFLAPRRLGAPAQITLAPVFVKSLIGHSGLQHGSKLSASVTVSIPQPPYLSARCESKEQTSVRAAGPRTACLQTEGQAHRDEPGIQDMGRDGSGGRNNQTGGPVRPQEGGAPGLEPR